MKVFQMPKHLFKPISRIGDLIPKNKLTLLTGLPGSGKSYSLLKFLNIEAIEPLYFNLDEDVALQELKLFSASPQWIKPVLNNKVVDLKDKVVVFDTYIRLMEYLKLDTTKNKDQKKIVHMLEKLAKKSKCTVIVIGHPTDFVGKDSIFKDNQLLVRNAAEHLHIESILPRGKTAAPIVHRLFVKKGRGNGGTRYIDEWMRSKKDN